MISDLKTLVIDTGDLAGLAAAAILPRPERAVLWHPIGDDDAAARRLAIVREQATFFGIPQVIEQPVAPLISVVTGDGQTPSGIGPDEACLILQAAKAAWTGGYQQILWPVSCEGTVEEAGQACEIGVLINHLADLTGPKDRPLKITTPFLDYTAEQILDLAIQSDAPLHQWWCCRHGGEDPCGGCPGCLKWAALFEQGNMVWPWSQVAAVV